VRAQGRPDERLPGGVVVEFKLDSAVQGGLWLEDESVGELVLDEEVVVVGVGGVEWLVPGEVDAGGGDRVEVTVGLQDWIAFLVLRIK